MTSSDPTTQSIWEKVLPPDQDTPYWQQAHAVLARYELQRRKAAKHPAFLLQHVECVDSRTGEVFQFTLLDEDESRSVGIPYRGDAWYWQRDYLDWILTQKQSVTLKGRQLGVTWVWAGLALWTALFKPGSDVLVYSIKEADAEEVVNRIWDMWNSLPAHLKPGIEVIKPTRGVRPSTRIELLHPDGRVSTIEGMVATKSAGHGRSAALVIFDEASRQEYARELWKAVIPASGDKGGMIGVVSTANGMSDGRGLGNFFHELWAGAGYTNYPNLGKKFLGWFLHPDRDQDWYDHVPLDESSKAEQYPNTPEEAFLLSGTPFFSTLALKFYAEEENKAPVQFKAEWHVSVGQPNRAVLAKGQGCIEVYRPPEPGKKYALAADIATGLGTDFSVGAVIDLSDGTPCAEVYMKGSYEDFAAQIHFTGLWFNTARIAPELGGGYGDTVIAYLRDGHKGRKPYPKLYRHRGYESAARKQTDRFGFPMNLKTRPKVISEIREWIDRRLMPWMPPGLLTECFTFVHRETRPSPRAADGTNDDRVMCWAIAYEMYAEFGEHEHDRKKSVIQQFKQAKKPAPIWKY